MFGDNTNDNTTNQQPTGDNTPPPMLDTPMSTDPVGTDSTSMSSPSLPEPTDPPSDDEQFTPSKPQESPDGAPALNDPATDLPAADDNHHDDKNDDFMTEPDASTSTTNSDELLTIKQQALQQLTPLVGHLDQTPKEEFRTTMMMIQATDNQELVKKAFEAAQKIEDDKERAQAFLDIINEINYFTQSHQE